MALRGWNIHVCALDSECRSLGAPPWRLNISTPWRFVSIALRLRDRFVRIDPVVWRERNEVVPLRSRWVDIKPVVKATPVEQEMLSRAAASPTVRKRRRRRA